MATKIISLDMLSHFKDKLDVLFNAKADSATTLSGYGITDAYTKTEVDDKVDVKADAATTLAGYGITDALQLGTSSTTAYAGNKGVSNANAITKLNGTQDTSGSVLNSIYNKAKDGEYSTTSVTYYAWGHYITYGDYLDVLYTTSESPSIGDKMSGYHSTFRMNIGSLDSVEYIDSYASQTISSTGIGTDTVWFYNDTNYIVVGSSSDQYFRMSSTYDYTTSSTVTIAEAIASISSDSGNTTYTLTQDSTDGHKITLTPSTGDATTITIPDNNTIYTSETAVSGGTDVSLVTTGEKYIWNNKAESSDIPDSLSDLDDDATHRLVTDAEKTTWNAKSDFSGSYNDLANKPTIPSGAAADKGVDTSISAGSTSDNLPTSAAVASFVEGKGYKTTDENTTYTLTQDSTDGHKITLTPSSGSATTITIPDSDTTYSVATTSTDGLMSSSDKSKLDGIVDPMSFKGSLGTNGTITTLPTASATNKGFTYKVITAGTYDSQAAQIGDTFISDGSSWVLIPSGDEPSGTVTSVKVEGTDGISGSGTITSSGTVTLSNAGVRSITQDGTDGHKLTINTGGTESTITIPDNNTTYTFNTAYDASTNKAATMSDVNGIKTSLEASFQDGVDGIYDAITAQGTTPASKSQSDVQTAIGTLSTNRYADGQNNIKNGTQTELSQGSWSNNKLTVTASAGYNASALTTDVDASSIYTAGVSATKVGTASAGDVLSGKTFTNASSVGASGTMTNNGAVSKSIGYGESYTVPAGYHNGSGKVTNSVSSGTITSGSASITSESFAYNSTNSNFDVTGSATISAPTVGTAGYVSSSVGTKNTNTASLKTTVAKVGIKSTNSGTTTVTPVISRVAKPSADTWTDGANGAATTTKPTSGVYVEVQSAANTGTLTSTPSVSSAGYGTTTSGQYTATAGTSTVGANASAATYVPIKTGTATTPTASAAASSTSLSGTTLTVARSVTPTVSAGWVSSGTAGTVTTTATVPTQTKTATPSTSSQTISPDSGKLLSSVTVNAISTETKTVTPSASEQTVTPTDGSYLSSVTVSGDENLVASNIVSGVSIFGVDGSAESSSAVTCWEGTLIAYGLFKSAEGGTSGITVSENAQTIVCRRCKSSGATVSTEGLYVIDCATNTILVMESSNTTYGTSSTILTYDPEKKTLMGGSSAHAYNWQYMIFGIRTIEDGGIIYNPD